MVRKTHTPRLAPPGLTLALLIAGFAGPVGAEETWFETKDGTTYRVTRRVEKTPVAETQTEQRTVPVSKIEYETEMRESVRTAWVPVTEYVTQPKWHGVWNPFAEPYVTYETRPVTRWELRTQTVREPVTRAKEIRHDKIVQVPTRSLGFVERPYEERIVVATPGNVPSTPSAETQYAQRAAPGVRTAEQPRGGQRATQLSAPPYRR